MLSGLIENFVLGFVITAVPGAVFFETIRRTLLGRRSVYGFLLGNFFGMTVVVTLAFLGLSLLMGGVITDLFYLMSGLLLLYMGVGTIVRRPKRGYDSGYSAFGTGLILAVANPMSILFWVSLTGKFMHDAQGIIWPLLYSLSVMCGALTLFVLLITLIGRLRPLLEARNLRRLSVLFGLVIIAYGVLTLSRVFG